MDLPEALLTIDLLRGQIEMLERLLGERDAKIRALETEMQLKRHDIARLRKQLHGDRSERVAPEELTLPGVDLAPSNDTATPPEPEKKQRVREHERTTKRRSPLTLDPACVTDKHVYVTPEQTACACCGAAMTSIGEETRVCVERVPACFVRTITHRLKFACGACKQGGVHIAQPEDYSVLGPTPPGPSLAADIAVMHYADHLPFHRIAGILRREGLTIDRGALSRIAGRVAEALRIVVASMERELLASDDVLGIDGTHVKILASPHCKRRQIYVVHGRGHVVFRALERDRADDVLEGFKGFLGVVECDAASTHTGSLSVSFGLRLALCNAHCRRKFHEARETDRARADRALRFFQHVAQHERRWKALDVTSRQRERDAVLRPIVERFRAWLIEDRPRLGPRTPMAGAFEYALSHWEGLTRFLDDGRIPWTNNESERLLRHLLVGRKAWVFRGSFEGAERGCVLWSLTMSCRLHGLDPRRYLLDTLEALRVTPHRRVHELTPREYAKRHAVIATAS